MTAIEGQVLLPSTHDLLPTKAKASSSADFSSPRFLNACSRLDRVINIDLGERGVEHLHAAATLITGRPLVAGAVELLDSIETGDVVVMTTGSAARSWISEEIGENDGPSGAAALVRAIAMSRRATVVVLAEEALLPGLKAMISAAGVTVLPIAQARLANRERSLLAASVMPFTTEDKFAETASRDVLDELLPSLLISIERTGRNADGSYRSMRGIDYSMGRARVDHLFDLAYNRNIPTIGIGDGGNEIGMANVAEAVIAHVPFGRATPDGGAGIGAVTHVTALVTAACSNWGAYALIAGWAALLGDMRLVHTVDAERALLRRGVDLGLINAVEGIVDDRVDNIASETHLAVTQLLSAIVHTCQ